MLIHLTYQPINKNYFKIPFAIQIGYSKQAKVFQQFNFQSGVIGYKIMGGMGGSTQNLTIYNTSLLFCSSQIIYWNLICIRLQMFLFLAIKMANAIDTKYQSNDLLKYDQWSWLQIRSKDLRFEKFDVHAADQ